jgi:hypothetical protein
LHSRNKQKNNTMNPYGMKIIRYLTFSALIYSFWGCVSEPVKTALPISHPANPQAQETPFNPPLNPFQTDSFLSESESTTGPDTVPKDHKKVDKPHMNHQTGQDNMNPPEEKSATKPVEEKSMHQHKEHHQ